MIDILRSLIAQPEPTRQEPGAIESVAALLVEAARADADYTDEERRGIERFLAHLFQLSPEEARGAREKGEAAQDGAADVVRFTRVVKTRLDERERAALIEALWRVVLSDGRRDPHEDALLRKLAPLIAVSDHDSAAARRRAQQD
jgi:uncharacterized tellurite resistance protein B-like protein